MNDLEQYFTQNTRRVIHKWQHYFEIYDRHFSRFRGTDVCVVEVGVYKGGSLQMWKDYFGPKATIVGIDINPQCKELEEEQIQVIIGSQEDRAFLRSVKEQIPRIDILIDDGGHKYVQQIRTYEELFPHIDANGVYLIEDLHTSYWLEFDGGCKRRGTFIEYCKDFIDYINAWHSEEEPKLAVSDFTRSVHSLHFYDSILAVEKRPMEKPYHLKTGPPDEQVFGPPPGLTGRVMGRIKRDVARIKRRLS